MKPTVHPIKILALAYGLMPEIGLAADQAGKRARRHLNFESPARVLLMEKDPGIAMD